MVRIKRVYDPPEPGDGRRLLIDRLWARGLTKEAARIDDWIKELAPSTELRKWFGHDPARWDEFQARYKEELLTQAELLAKLRAEAKKGTITLLFAAKDTAHNNAVVLKEMLE